MLGKLKHYLTGEKAVHIPKERAWLTKYKIHTFIDIGSYVGEYIDLSRLLFPKASIYAFEPLRDCYENLLIKTADMNAVKIYNLALGDKNATTVIHRSSYAPSSSLLPMADLHKKAFPFSSGSSEEKIQVKTLDSVLKNVSLKPNIFMKIDTQGFEDKVIRGGRRVLRQTAVVQLEVSFAVLYEGQRLFHDIYMQLYELGFSFHGMHNQILSPIDGSILQAHVYFINRNLRLGL